jgi:multiple sugar transport system permease protein
MGKKEQKILFLKNKPARYLKSSLVYMILVSALLFVLLPLAWMIVTALKQPGQAFKLNFWPQTRVISEPLQVKSFPQDKPVVIFEYINKTAQRVSVAGEINEWNLNANPMIGADGVWLLRMDDLKPGKYEYKFVVNGKKWITDPENKEFRNENSLIEIPEKGVITNKPLSNSTNFSEGTLNIRIKQEPSALAMSVITNEGKSVKLKKSGDFWVGEAKTSVLEISDSEASEVSYRIEKTRFFKSAFNAIYTIKNFNLIVNNKDFPFISYFKNSLIVATLAGILTVLICTMAGYAFAKKEFIFREALFAALLSAMLIPGMIFMVPQFSIVLKFGWINSFQGMVVPHLANVFGLFLLRQYIKTIPNSLFQAARIDGANELQVFTKIVIPLSFPIMVTLFLLTFVGQWSNFLWQLITNTPDSPCITLPIGLQLFKGQYAQDWEPIMAGACFSIIPIAVLFLIAQRFFIEGMTIGAVKE